MLKWCQHQFGMKLILTEPCYKCFWQWGQVHSGKRKYCVSNEFFSELASVLIFQSTRTFSHQTIIWHFLLQLCKVHQHTSYLSSYIRHHISKPLNCTPEKCVQIHKKKIALGQNSVNRYWTYLVFLLANWCFDCRISL